MAEQAEEEGATEASGSRGAPTITSSQLEQAALRYLERFSSSSSHLRLVLLRKVGRLSPAAEGRAAAEPLVDALIARYLAVGLLDDRAYAVQQAASLHRRGASRHFMRGRLAQKGLGSELVGAALAALDAEGQGEVAAACALARRRRLGAYRTAPAREGARDRDLATLARAGFSLDIARRVLAAPDRDAVERLARGEEEPG